MREPQAEAGNDLFIATSRSKNEYNGALWVEKRNKRFVLLLRVGLNELVSVGRGTNENAEDERGKKGIEPKNNVKFVAIP
jgi:hypothetical protein